MKQSAALATPLHQEAVRHLVRRDGQEDLCFGLWNPSRGSERETACLHELILPMNGEREVHGNVTFFPQYFARALSLARQRKCGLALLHSHVGPGWQDMSRDDIQTEETHAAGTFAATGLPLVGFTIGTDGAWSARVWSRVGRRRYTRRWCESVRVVGGPMLVTYHEALNPAPLPRNTQVRTISAWGPRAQANLARLKVGVVGAGSVGAMIAEALVRQGIGHVRLLDFDVVEHVNLDRLLFATTKDADLRRLKVNVLGKHLRLSATAKPFRVDAMDLSVVEESGYRAALDCDVLFSCVDRPWPRFVLNLIAYAHLIPVVDGGLLLTPISNDRGLKRATWRAHTTGLVPTHCSGKLPRFRWTWCGE